MSTTPIPIPEGATIGQPEKATKPGASFADFYARIVSEAQKSQPQQNSALPIPQGAVVTAPSSNPDLSSALDSITRMNTGQPMATPEQQAQFEQGRTAGSVSGLATAAAVPAAMTAPEWGPPVAKYAAQHPFATAFAVHLARELGIPLPKVLDVFSKFGAEK
jgi:hypothetical protein